jgi:hypothetical protein
MSRAARVYMLTEPASHYYQIMTRNDRMPVLIGERIFGNGWSAGSATYYND